MESWLLIACIAPALWAISNLIDVYFVESIYTDEYDGTIISGLFQILPWMAVLIGFWDFTFYKDGFFLLFTSGFLFLLALYFYFKALFSKNDVALAQLLWNITAPVTLVFGWMFYGEVLSNNQYLGFALVLLGAFCLGFKSSFRLSEFYSLAKPMFFAIILLSLSMLFSDKGYASNSGKFFDNYLIFSLGNFTAAIVFVTLKFHEGKQRLKSIGSLSMKYFLVFFIAELIALFGYIFSQKAIDLAPSASLVAAVESLIPVFIIFFSLMLLGFFLLFRRGSEITKKIYLDQVDGYFVKSVATIIIAIGIYFLSLT